MFPDIQNIFQLSLLNTTYIMSQSYPKYYLTGEDCSWRVRIPPHQSLLIRILDIQVRGPGLDSSPCVDTLGLDSKVDLCGEVARELQYVTNTNMVSITFSIGKDHQAGHHCYIVSMDFYCLFTVVT